MDEKEMFELARRSRAGDLRAREQLILSHLPDTVALVRQYAGRGVEWDELYQEACYGLILAVDRFDPDRGCQLKTYAYRWINKRLKKAIRENNRLSPIAPDERTFYKIMDYRQAVTDLSETLGRTPTDDEIAKHTGWSIADLHVLYSRMYSYISLDDDNTQNIIPAEKMAPSAEDEILQAESENEINFPGLHPRELEVVLRRHGFGDSGRPETFREISDAMGWAMETLRMDYQRAIRKLHDIAYRPTRDPEAAGTDGESHTAE